MSQKPRLLVVDQDPIGCTVIQQLLANSPIIVVGGVGYDEEALSVASELKPQIILVAVEEPSFQPLKTLRDLSSLLPDASIISYSSLRDVHTQQQTKASGAREHLTKPVSFEDLNSCIERALSGAAKQNDSSEPLSVEQPGATVFTMLGPKGGVGRTLISINMAASIAQAGHSTVLVDLDSVSGDVARRMKVRVDSSLLEADRHAAELDELRVESYLKQHPCGVNVLPAPREPTDWREINPQAVDRLLTLLAKAHECVIIDTPAGFTDLSIVAIQRADLVLLLSSLDPSSIDSTSTVLKMLNSEDSATARTKLILNHLTPGNSREDSDTAKELGCDVFWSLPYDESIAHCDEAGRPAVMSKPRAKISRSISKMASDLVKAGSRSPADGVRTSGSSLLGRVLRISP